MGINFYPLPSKEIDLREELNKMLFGSDEEVPKGQYIVLRRMRRNTGVSYPIKESDLQRCPCAAKQDFEADRVTLCQWCDGERFLFDDELVVAYKASKFNYVDVEMPRPESTMAFSQSFFYCEAPIMPSRFDKIIEPIIDIEGKLISPVQIKIRHNIEMAEPFRSDFGRIEFWRIGVISE